jgi:hypothetical protein
MQSSTGRFEAHVMHHSMHDWVTGDTTAPYAALRLAARYSQRAYILQVTGAA